MVNVEKIREILKEVYDPELGLNVVDLGLIYDIQVTEKNDVYVKMTLTTPGCPLHGSITAGTHAAIKSVPDVNEVNVDLVWEPAWNPNMMSEDAKKQLGR